MASFRDTDTDGRTHRQQYSRNRMKYKERGLKTGYLRFNLDAFWISYAIFFIFSYSVVLSLSIFEDFQPEECFFRMLSKA